MLKSLAVLLLTLTVTGAGSFIGAGTAAAAEFTPDAHFPNGDQARELLAEGVKEYRAGRPAQAAVRLRDALKLEPENKLLYEFYLAVGDRLLMDMQDKDVLEDVLKEILRGARIYQKQLRHAPEYINLMISKLEKSEEERLVATNELVSIGPIAVPILVSKLSDNRQDDMRVYVRVVLTKMGYRAVVPLNEALNAKDERTIASVATVLTDIGDPRSLPKLKQLSEAADTPETAKRVVANAIAGILHKSGMDQPPATKPVLDKKGNQVPVAPPKPFELGGADKLYFMEAARYFRGGDRVTDEMVADESLMWRWNEDEQDASKKLGYIRVPRYAWNELMAEQLLFDGSRYYVGFTAYQPLLAADLAAQDVEANRRSRIAKERTTPIQNPDEAMDAIAERVKALDEMSLRVRMFGPDHLYRAVQQSIASERYEVAVYLMRVLEDRYLADADRLLPSKEEGLNSDKSGTVLVAALDHGEKSVRYQAAITLAHLDPALQFFNAEKVVPLLAEAVGEWGMRVVVVVDQDYRQRNTAREQLQQQGYLALAVSNGHELMQRLEESPVKDAIIIAGDMLPDLRDEYGGKIDVPEQKVGTLLEKLSKDWRADKTPVFISLPEDAKIAADIQTAFDGKPGVKGFIKKPFSGAELKGKIEAALKDGAPVNGNRDEAEDISLRAAKALQHPDPARTQYDLSQAAAALTTTLDARSDELRIETCKALGIAAQHPNGAGVKGNVTKVADIYGTQDGVMKPAVRAAFLYAMGQLDPSTEAAVGHILKALKHEDAQVRAAAAAAVGHAPTITNELLYKYQLQQRLDARAPGAGKEPGAAKDAAPAPAAKAKE